MSYSNAGQKKKARTSTAYPEKHAPEKDKRCLGMFYGWFKNLFVHSLFVIPECATICK